MCDAVSTGCQRGHAEVTPPAIMAGRIVSNANLDGCSKWLSPLLRAWTLDKPPGAASLLSHPGNTFA